MKKQVKKAVLGHFLENFDEKIAFFLARALPQKMVYIGAQGVFRKILESVGQKWTSYKVTKGGPLGRQGVESLKRKRPPALPPKSAPGSD